MQCQVCGTVDQKHGRGPVKVHGAEGLCEVCSAWAIRMRKLYWVMTGRFLQCIGAR